MHTFFTAHARTSKSNNMDHDARIRAAIADLESQDRINYKVTAIKWGLKRTTLARRHRGETGSKQEANSYARQKLTDTQEKTLIRHINKLSDRGFPPTPQIVKNLAEEIAGVALGPNWVSRFCKRHQKQLLSVYLRTIDHKRKLADNSYHFKYFYDQVRMIFICVLCAVLKRYACVLTFFLVTQKNREI
jgi:Tc5 transposase DNA-binding domain